MIPDLIALLVLLFLVSVLFFGAWVIIGAVFVCAIILAFRDHIRAKLL